MSCNHHPQSSIKLVVYGAVRPTNISKWVEVSWQSSPHAYQLFTIGTQPSYSFPSPPRNTIFIMAVQHTFPMHSYSIHSIRVGIAPIWLALVLYRSRGSKLTSAYAVEDIPRRSFRTKSPCWRQGNRSWYTPSIPSPHH